MDLGTVIGVGFTRTGDTLGNRSTLVENRLDIAGDLVRIAKGVTSDDDRLAETFQLRIEQQTVHKIKTTTTTTQHDRLDGRVGEPTKERGEKEGVFVRSHIQPPSVFGSVLIGSKRGLYNGLRASIIIMCPALQDREVPYLAV